MYVVEERFVTKNIQRELRKIYNNKEKINIDYIMDCIINELNQYNILSATSTEIIVKIDKKTNTDELKDKIIDCINKEIKNSNININFLFKFIIINNEFIIRLKRKID